MAEPGLPTLWIYGPPGVGKSVIGWRLFEQIAVSGTPAGYVDIDQLGICYGPPQPGGQAPEPPDDPGRHRMKARNLDAVAMNQRAAGAQLLVVSGVVDAHRGVDHGLLPHASVRTLRLRADAPDLRRRLRTRGRPGTDVTWELAYADDLDRLHAGDDCVDTTDLAPPEVLERVTATLDGWPVRPAGRRPPGDHRGGDASGEVLLLCGATAVGKSTVGWQVYERVRTSGVHAAFVDLEQIGFHRPAPPADPYHHRLKAANLAAIWRTFRAAGAERLVMVGAVDNLDAVHTYAAALPSASLTVCRLHAGRDTLRTRIRLRGQGVGVDLAGDRLIGQPEAVLQTMADQAAVEAEALDRAHVGDVRIDTDGRYVEQIVDEILLATRFAGAGGGQTP